MVHLYSVIIINPEEDKIINSFFELSDFGFFKRPTIKELCLFAGSESVKRTNIGQRTALEYKNFMCYSYVLTSKLAISCITDNEYPQRIALQFLNDVSLIDQKLIEQLLLKYQDINRVDKISAIKHELNETTKACEYVIDKLLIREDEMNDLLLKTEKLADDTKIFLGEAEKMNSCC